jgi:hypothetical protein
MQTRFQIGEAILYGCLGYWYDVMVCSVLIVCWFKGSFFFFVVVWREIHFQNVKMSYKIENVSTKLGRIIPAVLHDT